ncbi:MAG TPA: condensation domain-containing protein, partial [Thermoanaerobaculia bacterium]
VFELFVPWSRGGKVVLASNALELPDLPAAAEVTFVNTVPSAMAELVRTGAVPAGVRAVGLAGEELRRPLADGVHAVPHVRHLYNLYGPSETTTYSTWETVTRDAEKPSIGRPVGNTDVHLLDRGQAPVAAGEVGELYLGGAGVARGYLKRPARTAVAFLPDPFARRPGERLYRTGDLARRGADGRLDFLGRKDHQVKVRGFRIELGEIEAALERSPAVRAVAVEARDGAEPEEKLLVAWVEPEGDVSEDALRDFVSRALPSYMVPQAFVFVDEMPLTPSGKVDRTTLRRRPLPSSEGRPAPGRDEADARYRAPRGAAEEAVAAVWAAALGRERVGRDDGFVALGGHSLIAVRIVARLKAVLGVDLPQSAPFEHGTVAAQAAAVAAAGTGETPTLDRTPFDHGRVPLCLRLYGLWLLEQQRPGEPTYNVPLLLELRGPLSVPALAAALAEIGRRHEILRTTFTVDDGVPVQCLGTASSLALTLADLGALPPAARLRESERLRGREARRAFDLETGPVVRAHLQRLGPEEHALLLGIHHLVTDEWSNNVLIEELAALYQAAASRQAASPLPPVSVQYA